MSAGETALCIQRADLTDLNQRNAVALLLDEYLQDPMGGSQHPLCERKKATMLSGLAMHPAALVLLAFIGNFPAGMAVCFRGFSTFAAAPLINVHDLIVAHEFRRRGIGRLLLKEVAAIARDECCCRVTLEVREDNRAAKALYRSLGFSRGAVPLEFWTLPL